jgi:F0F1-type ATP synthase membrane subunit b/b'
MFHISVAELALTCGVILLVFILPVLWKRFNTDMDRRLKNIEKKIEKKR